MFTGVFYKPHNSESDVAQIPRTNTTHGAVGTITHTHTHTPYIDGVVGTTGADSRSRVVMK